MFMINRTCLSLSVIIALLGLNLITVANVNADQKALCASISEYSADILSLRLSEISDQDIYRVLQKPKITENKEEDIKQSSLKDKIVKLIYSLQLEKLNISLDSDDETKIHLINKIKKDIDEQCHLGQLNLNEDEINYKYQEINEKVEETKIAINSRSELKLTKEGFYIQVGSFSHQSPNNELLKSINNYGFEYILHQDSTVDNQQYKVYIGPFPNKQRASGYLPFVKEQLAKDAFIIIPK